MTSNRVPSLAALALAAALFTGLATAASAADLRFNASTTSGVAPLAVHFDATDTDCDGDGNGGEWPGDLIDCSFSWSFGDAAAGEWKRGAWSRTQEPRSKNSDHGFVTAHVFEEPGTYSVTLTVRNESGVVGSTTRTIRVSPWSGPTYCVHTGGSVSAGSGGCPAGATVVETGDFNSALENSANVDSRPARVLFRRGDRFTASSEVSQANGPGIIGSFGTGPAPIVTHGSYTLFEGSNDWRILDLDIRGNRHPDSHVAKSGYRNLYLRVDTRDHGGGTFSLGSTRMASGESNFFVIDSDIGPNRDHTSNRGTNNGIFAYCTECAFMGNRWHSNEQNGNSDGHCSRLNGTIKSVLAHEDRTDCPLTALTMRAPKVENDRTWSEYNLVRDQYVAGNKKSLIIQVGQISGSFESNFRRLLVEDSLIRATTGNDRDGINVSGKEVVVRNTVFDMQGGAGSRRGVRVEKPDADSPTYALSGIRVQNVTCYECDTIFDDRDAHNGELIDSLIYAPNQDGELASGDVSVVGSVSGGSFPFVDSSPGDSIASYRVSRGVEAINAGGAGAALVTDASGALRDSSPDAGAFELDGDAPDSTPDEIASPFLLP